MIRSISRSIQLCHTYIAAELIKNSKQTYVECLHFDNYSPLQYHSYVHYRKSIPYSETLIQKIHLCLRALK